MHMKCPSAKTPALCKERSNVGRLGRGAEASQVIALRLTSGEIAALYVRGSRKASFVLEVIREALESG